MNAWPRLHSFSIGLPGSPDLAAAKKVAEFLGTVHHAFTFTVQDGVDAIEDVVYHLETYDVTTIRASTPMYLLSRKIKAMGVKMVLSGEGSDEIFGGESFLFDRRTDFLRILVLPQCPVSSGIAPRVYSAYPKLAHF